jgi:hypothetical protein
MTNQQKGNTTMNTLTAVLERAGITVPDQTIADLEVPVLTGPQRQGDVFVIPIDAIHEVIIPNDAHLVPAEGVAVVVGEATGNTHLLQPEPGCGIFWQPARARVGSVELGDLTVPKGATAWLIHTDEHGANGIGPGTYRFHGKREQADEERRVAD